MGSITRSSSITKTATGGNTGPVIPELGAIGSYALMKWTTLESVEPRATPGTEVSGAELMYAGFTSGGDTIFSANTEPETKWRLMGSTSSDGGISLFVRIE